MAYREFKPGEKAQWYTISKEKHRGRYVVTPFRSKPKLRPSDKAIIVSGNKHHYHINEYGYSTTNKLPTPHKTKRKASGGLWSFPKGRGGFW